MSLVEHLLEETIHLPWLLRLKGGRSSRSWVRNNTQTGDSNSGLLWTCFSGLLAFGYSRRVQPLKPGRRGAGGRREGDESPAGDRFLGGVSRQIRERVVGSPIEIVKIRKRRGSTFYAPMHVHLSLKYSYS